MEFATESSQNSADLGNKTNYIFLENFNLNQNAQKSKFLKMFYKFISSNYINTQPPQNNIIIGLMANIITFPLSKVIRSTTQSILSWLSFIINIIRKSK